MTRPARAASRSSSPTAAASGCCETFLDGRGIGAFHDAQVPNGEALELDPAGLAARIDVVSRNGPRRPTPRCERAVPRVVATLEERGLRTAEGSATA